MGVEAILSAKVEVVVETNNGCRHEVVTLGEDETREEWQTRIVETVKELLETS